MNEHMDVEVWCKGTVQEPMYNTSGGSIKIELWHQKQFLCRRRLSTPNPTFGYIRTMLSLADAKPKWRSGWALEQYQKGNFYNIPFKVPLTKEQLLALWGSQRPRKDIREYIEEYFK